VQAPKLEAEILLDFQNDNRNISSLKHDVQSLASAVAAYQKPAGGPE